MSDNPKDEQDKDEKKELAKRGRRAGEVLFPRDPLQRSLDIPKAIWEQNGGNPFSVLDVAPHVGYSPTSSGFRQLMASSYRYGLTEGSLMTRVLSLTPLGKSIVAPLDTTDVGTQLRKALLNNPLFEKAYFHFDGKPLPREDVLKNTFTHAPEMGGLGIPREDVLHFIKIFMQNIQDYGLVQEIRGAQYLRLDKLGKQSTIVTSDSQLEKNEFMDVESISETVFDEGQKVTPSIPPITTGQQIPKQIFVAHGKNTKPLEQLEKILNKFKVNYKVAVDEPHSGRPISTKVAELMKNCTSGVFIFTADEKTQDADGNELWRPSDNVVYELGAASALYGNKIVIFKENDVKFASDFSDFGYISFEKDKLDAKAADLMIELINLGFMQVTPT